MSYSYAVGDEDALIVRLGPHFTPYAEPMDVQVPLSDDPVWKYLRPDLQLVGNGLLRLELDEDERSSARVMLGDLGPAWGASARPARPTDEEQKLWRAVAERPSTPPSMEVIVRDLLLSTGVDTTPTNAERAIEAYRAIASGPADSLHVALAILRANTIARSRDMAVEATIRAQILVLAERALTGTILPGISLRHAEAVAEPPRVGTRAADELIKLAAVLDHVGMQHRDESTLGWVTKSRLAAAATDADREVARRRHVEQLINISDNDSDPFRAMIWAETAVSLASDYGITDLHDSAVVQMQKLSRTDLGWHRQVSGVTIPIAVYRQRERHIARYSSWEQAVAGFLATDSPSGSSEKNERQVAALRRGILDLASGRSFGPHQMPERTHGPADEENLARLVRVTLGSSAIVLRHDLTAIMDRFGVPDEDKITAFLSTIYGSAPKLVRPFSRALRLYWSGDPSGAARLAIPLVETGARELLFLMDQPLYRLERGGSPGRFPAMDFYVDKLEDVGLDRDWATAIRGTLLSEGMNLRNRFAHGFQLDFTADEAALVLRLAGLFIGMPVGIGAIDDERVRTPLRAVRKRLRRRPGWTWR